MLVYRITKTIYANDLSGTGAAAYGGRWNPKDYRMLYCSTHRSLAYCEFLAHLRPEWTKACYQLLTIKIPEDMVGETFSSDELPMDWSAFPVEPSSQMIGKRFLEERKHLFMEVPSVLIPEEKNVLINPRHEHFSRIEITHVRPLYIDDRHL